jgi:hypothetical protein
MTSMMNVPRQQRFDRQWWATVLAIGIPAVPYLLVAIFTGLWLLAVLASTLTSLPICLAAESKQRARRRTALTGGVVVFVWLVAAAVTSGGALPCALVALVTVVAVSVALPRSPTSTTISR